MQLKTKKERKALMDTIGRPFTFLAVLQEEWKFLPFFLLLGNFFRLCTVCQKCSFGTKIQVEKTLSKIVTLDFCSKISYF